MIYVQMYIFFLFLHKETYVVCSRTLIFKNFFSKCLLSATVIMSPHHEGRGWTYCF